MSSPSPNAQQPATNRLKDLVSSPFFNGLVAFLGLLAALESVNLWIRVPAILIALWFAFHFLRLIYPTLQNVASRLTRKFFIGIIAGIVIGIIAMPLIFQPMLSSLLPLVVPKITFLDSFPTNGETLPEAISGVMIRFSKSIPSPYEKLIQVDIYPPFPIRIEWSSDNQTLYVMPDKIYPANESNHILNPRFEYDAIYDLIIKGPTLVEPVRIEFRTPKE